MRNIKETCDSELQTKNEKMRLSAHIKIWIFLLTLTMQTNLIFAQGSKIFENLSLHSNILNMERKFSIYLPAGYDKNDRDYPVLYLLHGGGGNHITWVQSGEVQFIADKTIAQGAAIPMIIVMPNARDKIKGYYNYIKDGFDYEDFFFEELIPYIEKNYRCRTKSRYRAIAGQSMGGGGTLFYALHHPKIFSAAALLSAVTGSWSKQDLRAKLKRKKIDNVSNEQFNAYYKKYSIKVKLSLCGGIQVRTPAAKILYQASIGRKQKQLSMLYNPATKSMDPLVCEGCADSTFNIHFCDHLHILCPACSASCPAC